MKTIKFLFYLICALLSLSGALISMLIGYIGISSIINYLEMNCPELLLYTLLCIFGIGGVSLGWFCFQLILEKISNMDKTSKE